MAPPVLEEIALRAKLLPPGVTYANFVIEGGATNPRAGSRD
jgi:hypothetical protein